LNPLLWSVAELFTPYVYASLMLYYAGAAFLLGWHTLLKSVSVKCWVRETSFVTDVWGKWSNYSVGGLLMTVRKKLL